MTPEPIKVTWKRLDHRIERRLLEVLQSWDKTPYLAGNRAKGQGVDCVQLIAGVLDELYRYPTPAVIPRLPPTSGVHSPQAAYKTISALRHFFTTDEVTDGSVAPGDILVTRGIFDIEAEPNMGHVLIAGVKPLSALHAVAGGVCWTSFEGLPGLLKTYRPLNKEKWI